MPGLVGKFYSRLPGDIDNGNKADQSTEPVYCTMEWIHFDCLKLDSKPKTKNGTVLTAANYLSFAESRKKDL